MSGGPQVVFIPLRGCLFYGLGFHGIHHHQKPPPFGRIIRIVQSRTSGYELPQYPQSDECMQAQTISSQKFHIDTLNRSFLFFGSHQFPRPIIWGIWLLAPILSPTFCPKEFQETACEKKNKESSISKQVFFSTFSNPAGPVVSKNRNMFLCSKKFSGWDLDVLAVFLGERELFPEGLGTKTAKDCFKLMVSQP